MSLVTHNNDAISLLQAIESRKKDAIVLVKIVQCTAACPGYGGVAKRTAGRESPSGVWKW